MDRTLHRNIITIYLMSFFQNAMVVTAVFVPLMQRHGLSMAEVLQTQAVFALVVAALEVPSGYLADLWGRKNTIALGALLCVLAFGWLIVADSYVDFLIYELLMGVGICLNSGADLALLYDSQTYLNQQGAARYHRNNSRHITKLVSIESFAGGFAAVLASLLSYWSLDWVLWSQALISVLAMFFAFRLIETPRTISTAGHSENWHNVKASIVQKPLVLWTALTIIIFSLSALFAFWLYQKYWQLQGIPLTWFGYIWALHCIIRGVTARYANSIETLLGPRKVFILVATLPVIGFLGMGLFGGWVGLCLGLAFPISRGLSLVIFYDALNKRLDGQFRATVNSMVSLGIRGLFILTGPILGYLVDSQGVQNSLLLLAVLFIPLFALVLVQLFGKINNERGTDKSDPILDN